jgi:UDP-galactopyranose mutase
MNKKILIVGAGFSGATIARELADKGYKVTVIDKRKHVAGNAHDYTNEHGIKVHTYGPHLFHTSNMKIVEWLSRFTEWVEYKHKVKALLKNGSYVTLPVNAQTSKIVGKENIVDILFRPYTKKMWGMEIESLDASILQRIPIRDDDNEFYFPNDTFQAIPAKGYTNLINNILNHENIIIRLGEVYDILMNKEYFHVFNSMPIDEFFDYKFGELPYRSIKFHTHTLPIPQALPVTTVNFTHDGPYTRVTEWKKLPLHGDSQTHTTITIEEPCDYKENSMERYYPVKDLSGVNTKRYSMYKEITPSNISFIGRCGLYAYLDMHQAISSALSIAKNFIEINDN